MPHIISSGITRKDFLKKSFRIGGALAAWGMFYEPVRASNNDSVHLAILADTHVAAYKNEQYRGFFPSKNLIKLLNSNKSDIQIFVIVFCAQIVTKLPLDESSTPSSVTILRFFCARPTVNIDLDIQLPEFGKIEQPI